MKNNLILLCLAAFFSFPIGVLADPMVPDGVSGASFLAMTEGFMAAFGDLSLEVLEVIHASDELVAVQWLM